MTQLEKAKKGIITKEMKFVAKKENLSSYHIMKEVKKGTIVIPANIKHKNLKPIGIGKGLTTKVNVNLGTSPEKFSLKEEIKKLEISMQYKTDTVMDLSTGGNTNQIRKELIKLCPVPFGTVPIYQTAIEVGDILKITEKDLLKTIELHCRQGVDFITVHAGIRKKDLPLLKSRLTGVVSRGGSFLVKWMIYHKKENPLYENFDKLLKIAKKYDVTLSLGDGLRPGCLHDASDKAQFAELKALGKLAKRAHEAGVQAMIEGPGHVPLNQIEKNVKLQKKICNNAPFYVLGPLVTDIAPGYDHITSAIGGCLAAYYGVDFICYVTPAEHLRLPTLDDVKEGLIASKIAAHAADIAKGVKNSRKWDDEMSRERMNFNWKKQICLSLDPEKALKYRKESGIKGDVCTMCGKFCSMKVYSSTKK